MKLSRLLIPLVVIVCLFGSVGVGLVFGWWQVSAQPLTISSSPDVANIKGSSTLQEVSAAYGIPQDALYQLLGLPADTPFTTQLKELESVIEVSEVRTRIQAYLDQASSGTTAPNGTAAAQPASSEPVSTAAPSATPAPAASAQATAAAEPACEIKGSLSLEQVSQDCGVPLDYLYTKLELPQDLPSSTLLKDISGTVPGFEVSVLREVVAAYQAQ
ncbi:MAG: hypothetical protein ACYC6L_06660 [Anaerolineae bacterium]